MAKHHGLYDSSPSIKHEEGKAKVVKPTKDNKESAKSVKDEGYPVHVRQAHERTMMNVVHEHEHQMNDHHKQGDKAEIHARHETERKAMHTRHEKEAGANGGKEAGAGGSTGEPIEKVEKNAKE